MTASFSLDDVDLVRLDILASRLASLLKAGDVIALSGPLGAGKTTFARALVTRLDGEGEVPSPTFALMQRYETPRLTLTHCDFYRLEPAELDELGLDDALTEGAVLIEWPERAAGWLPADRLDIAMDETATPNERRIVLTGHGGWEPRLERLEQMASFLDRTPYAAAPARYLQGDASTRSYARLVLPDRAAILMNSPRQPDGPPIRDGKPYSALVHLAEDVTPFVAVAGALRERGLSAPAVYAFDLDQGFLILEDLGDRVFGSEVARGGKMGELWGAAVDVLAALAHKAPPAASADRRPRALPAARFRCRGDADRGVAPDRLVLAGPAWQANAGRACRGVQGLVAAAAGGGGKNRPGLGAQGLSLAQSDVAAGAGGGQKGRHSRLPGRAFRARSPTTWYRCSRTPGSRFRKRLNGSFSLATVPPGARNTRTFRAIGSSRFTRRSAPNETLRSSASLRDWRNVTASAVISLISRGSRATSSATSLIPLWPNSAASMRANFPPPRPLPPLVV